MILQTGTSDIPLTARGVDQIRSKAKILVGSGGQSSASFGYASIGKVLLEQRSLTPRICAWCSCLPVREPTRRSICCSNMSKRSRVTSPPKRCANGITVNTKDCTPPKSRRKIRPGRSGQTGEVSSGRHGVLTCLLPRCPGGESVDEMTCRVDTIISKVKRHLPHVDICV